MHQVERDFLSTLEGGCTAPIGAYAYCEDDTIHFSGGLYSLKEAPQKIKKSFPKKKPFKWEQYLPKNYSNKEEVLMKEFKKGHA